MSLWHGGELEICTLQSAVYVPRKFGGVWSWITAAQYVTERGSDTVTVI